MLLPRSLDQSHQQRISELRIDGGAHPMLTKRPGPAPVPKLPLLACQSPFRDGMGEQGRWEHPGTGGGSQLVSHEQSCPPLESPLAQEHCELEKQRHQSQLDCEWLWEEQASWEHEHDSQKRQAEVPEAGWRYLAARSWTRSTEN